MDFLQHANRYQAGSAEVGGISRSRENERRRALKIQNNFTTFFQANRVPLKETERNRLHSSSTHAIEPDSYQKKIRQEGDENAHRMSRYQSQPLDYPKHSYLGFGQPGPSSEKAASRVPANIGNYQSWKSLPSERATSYVSWSETQDSPYVTAMKNRVANVEEARETHSPTPESIRRIIEETGIFRNTGIKTSSHHENIERDLSCRENLREQKRTSTPGGRSEAHTSSTKSNAGFGQHARITDQQRRPDASESIPKEARAIHRPHHTREHPQAREPSGERDPKGIIAEHFDRKQGWHQQLSPAKRVSQTPVSATRSEPQRNTSTPLSREQIAKQARIKRSLTSMSRLSNPSILHPIPETEVEAEQEEQHPMEYIRNTLQNMGPDESESVLHPNHDKPLEHTVISGISNRAVSSLRSVATPDFGIRSGFGIIQLRSAQTTPFTQATSDIQNLQSARGLNGNIATPQSLYYLGLPFRGGSAVNSNVSPSVAVHPIYTSQVVQSNIYERPEEYNELSRYGKFRDHLEFQENEIPSYTEDAQYEHDEEYQGNMDARGNHFVAGGDVYKAPQFEAQNSHGPYVWQPNSEDYHHDAVSYNDDQINSNDKINDNYGAYGMEFGEENYIDGSMLEQQEDQMGGFWRPQWKY